MKRFLLPLFSLLIFVPFAAAQPRGEVCETEFVDSKILGEKIHFSIYVPPGYAKSDMPRRYPVLYLLHGYSDDQTGWTQFGEVRRIADEAISSGKSAPMIIVMPDAKKTFYVNRADGSYSYEDFFFKELIPHIEANYPVRAKKEFRAVAGLSMGGYGTFLYALKHGDMFAAACPLSAAVQSDDGIRGMPYERYKNRFNEFFGEVVGENEDRITDAWKANSIEHLLKNLADEKKVRTDTWNKMTPDEKKANEQQRREQSERDRERTVRFYIDCGDDDFLLLDNLKVPAWLREAGVPFEFRIRNGTHSWSYWREALPGVMSFVSESFRR